MDRHLWNPKFHVPNNFYNLQNVINKNFQINWKKILQRCIRGLKKRTQSRSMEKSIDKIQFFRCSSWRLMFCELLNGETSSFKVNTVISFKIILFSYSYNIKIQSVKMYKILIERCRNVGNRCCSWTTNIAQFLPVVSQNWLK